MKIDRFHIPRENITIVVPTIGDLGVWVVLGVFLMVILGFWVVVGYITPFLNFSICLFCSSLRPSVWPAIQPSIHPSIHHHQFFSAFRSGFCITTPAWVSLCITAPAPPTHDFGSRVYGLVFLWIIIWGQEGKGSLRSGYSQTHWQIDITRQPLYFSLPMLFSTSLKLKPLSHHFRCDKAPL